MGEMAPPAGITTTAWRNDVKNLVKTIPWYAVDITSVSRNAAGNVTQVIAVSGGQTITVNITRDANQNVTDVATTIT